MEASWATFETEAPQLDAFVRGRFEARGLGARRGDTTGRPPTGRPLWGPDAWL